MMWFLNMLLVLMLLLFCRQVLVRSPPKHPLFSKAVSLPPVPFPFWRKRQALKRDGELIAFIRLYEMSQHRRMQLSSFCEYAAIYLPLLRSDLLQFSQRLTLDGADQAFQWLQSRFPNDHPFAQHVFTYLQTSQTAQAKESSTHSGNRLFLEKLSRDFYERRKKANAPLFNLVNMLPSFLVFFMILLLLISYMGIVMEGMSL
jgi:hypothetical protein